MAFRHTTRRALLAASCALGALTAANAAHAQAVGGEGATPMTGSTLPEVVVTAQKRVENVQNVPEEVTVVSSQFLSQLHATSLEDIAGYVPGLQVTTGGTPGETTIGLRGIYPIASNITVGTYVDDIPVGGSSLFSNAAGFSLDLLPYDVANIQVLSGPQGTLYGASTLGGLIKYELNQPSLQAFHGEIGGDIEGVEHGGDPGGGVRATINGPLIKGQLGIIASYALEDTPGYVDDAQLGQKDVNSVRQQGARLGLLWTPDALPRLRVELNGLYQQIQADGLGEVALSAGSARPVVGELKDDSFMPQTFRKTVDILSDRTTYDFGFADLTSITSYEYTDSSQVEDVTTAFSPLAIASFAAPASNLGPIATTLGITNPLTGAVGSGVPVLENQHIQLAKSTEEVRLASKPNAHFEWLVGAYVTYEHSALYQDVSITNPNGTHVSSYALPAAYGGTSVPSALEVIGLPSIYREYAGFGDFTWHITPKLDLQGGVRYSSNTQNFKQSTSFNIVPGASIKTGRSSDDVVTFSVSPSYKLTRDLNVYVRFASGYQPGGPNIIIPGENLPPTVAADTLTQYEVGLKSQFLDRRGTLNLAAFYNNWNNIQIAALDQASETSYLANGGNAKTEGFDASGSFIVVPGLTMSGTFEYVYAVFKDVEPSVASALGVGAGSPLPQIPRFSGSVQANWAHRLFADWTYGLGGALRLEGSRVTAINYITPQESLQGGLYYREPGYGALDLNASVQNERYTVRLFAKNITDTRSYNSYATLGGPQLEGILLQPRTVGLSVDAKF